MKYGDSQLDVLRGGTWARLPVSYLELLATRFDSPASAQEFRIFFESNGLLEKLIASNFGERDAEIALSLTAIAITALGYSLAKSGNNSGAKYAWSTSLKVEPNHLPTWSGMAVLAFNEEDYVSAAKWSRTVLDLSGSNNRGTYQGKLNDDVLSGRFDEEAAKGMGMPQLVGASETLIAQMRDILHISNEELKA